MSAINLIKYLPSYYQDGRPLSEQMREPRLMQNVLAGQQKEIEMIYSAIEGCFDTNFAKICPDWGIEAWEEMLGIIPMPKETPIIRKSRILVMLSWARTSSRKTLEEYINSDGFTKKKSGEIELHNEEYYFNVLFDIDDEVKYYLVEKVLNLYKPAHLAHYYPIVIRSSLTLEHKLFLLIRQTQEWPFWIRKDWAIDWSGICFWDAKETWHNTSASKNHQEHELTIIVNRKVRTYWDGQFKWNKEISWSYNGSDDRGEF